MPSSPVAYGTYEGQKPGPSEKSVKCNTYMQRKFSLSLLPYAHMN